MFTIYGSQTCSYCTQAKELAERKGIEYNYVDTFSDEDAMTLFEEKGFRTVPQVYFNGEHVGGYQDMTKFVETL